jgi:penicillin-binding protein 1A
VHNDEGVYSGSNTQTGATAFSDKSIYAEVGLKVGTHKIALLVYKVDITTPLSTNSAMTIGGLTVGLRRPPGSKEDRMNNVLRFYS